MVKQVANPSGTLKQTVSLPRHIGSSQQKDLIFCWSTIVVSQRLEIDVSLFRYIYQKNYMTCCNRIGAIQKTSFQETVATRKIILSEKSTEGIVSDCKIREGKLTQEQEQIFLCVESNYFQV